MKYNVSMSKNDDELAVIIAAIEATRRSRHYSDEELRKKEQSLIARTKTSRFVMGIISSAIYAVGFFYFGFMALSNGDGISLCVAAVLFGIGVYCICRKPVRKSIEIVHERWEKNR